MNPIYVEAVVQYSKDNGFTITPHFGGEIRCLVPILFLRSHGVRKNCNFTIYVGICLVLKKVEITTDAKWLTLDTKQFAIKT